MRKLCTALARAAGRRVSEFNAKELANMAWAPATVRRPDAKLFTALARAAERWVSEFNAHDLEGVVAEAPCLSFVTSQRLRP